MWSAFDLVNRGEFMELGSPRLIGGGSPRLIGAVPETKGVKNGVSS